MDGEHAGNTLVGIYIDVSGGAAAESSLCLVEETPTGRLVMTAADDPNRMRIILPHIDGPGLEELMRLFQYRRRVA